MNNASTQQRHVGRGLVPRQCRIKNNASFAMPSPTFRQRTSPRPTGVYRRFVKQAIGVLMLTVALYSGAAAAQRISVAPALHVYRFGAALPPDVKAGHWAAPFVQAALANGVMSLPDGREFHGEAKVTRQEASILLARLAQTLEAGRWQTQPSRPIGPGALKTLEHGDWATQRVTRYEMAKILANMGDYVANGLPRPDAGAKNLGKSEALPPRPVLKITRANPAYAALTYLVEARMITPKSPLLKADDTPILGGEMSRALAEMVTGLADRQTDRGLDESGSTPDKSFQRKPGDKHADGDTKPAGK